MNPTIKEQILAVRDTGETNMFDANAVQQIANREGFYELVCYLESHRREYSRFILTGDESETRETEPQGSGRESSGRGQSAYERTKRAVYATGNKWAIENFHATHD